MDPLFYEVAIYAGGLGAFIWAATAAKGKIKCALRRAPLSAIADAKDGKLVKLVGKIVYAGEPLEAPLSGRSCAYYQAMAKRSAALIDEVRHCPEMWIEDASGRALVQMTTPTVVLVLDAKSHSGILGKTTARHVAFLHEHGQMNQGRFDEKNFHYTEGALEAGEEIVVFGLCKMEPDPDARSGVAHGYRESAMRARIVDPPGGKMLISDDPKMVGPS